MDTKHDADRSEILGLVAAWGRALEVRDIDVTVGGDVAFVHRMHHMIPADPAHPWMRMTLAFRRIDGRWRAVHEHTSVPFDPMSGRIVNITDPDAALPAFEPCAAGEAA